MFQNGCVLHTRLLRNYAPSRRFKQSVRRLMHISPTNLTLRSLIACATLALLVTGCDDRKSSSAPIVTSSFSSNSSISAPSTDKWLGRWIGPEGTFLQLAGGGGKYQITIQNLDGPRTFEGTTVGDQIAFERNGVKEYLHATNGTETGMKWLSEKSDCLTVRLGEGYCRD
jgi:hypothetical protein